MQLRYKSDGVSLLINTEKLVNLVLLFDLYGIKLKQQTYRENKNLKYAFQIEQSFSSS